MYGEAWSEAIGYRGILSSCLQQVTTTVCRWVFKQRTGGAVSYFLLRSPSAVQPLWNKAVTQTVPSLTSLPNSMSFYQLLRKKHYDDEQHDNENCHQERQQEILLLLTHAFRFHILLCKRGRCMSVLLKSFLWVSSNKNKNDISWTRLDQHGGRAEYTLLGSILRH